MDPDDIAAIESVAADYIEGWYRGDSVRMDRALHADLLKRIVERDEGSGEAAFRGVTKERMLESTAAGGGGDPNAVFDVAVDDVSGDIATARTISPEYVDYLHLVRTDRGWKIANVLFRLR